MSTNPPPASFSSQLNETSRAVAVISSFPKLVSRTLSLDLVFNFGLGQLLSCVANEGKPFDLMRGLGAQDAHPATRMTDSYYSGPKKLPLAARRSSTGSCAHPPTCMAKPQEVDLSKHFEAKMQQQKKTKKNRMRTTRIRHHKKINTIII